MKGSIYFSAKPLLRNALGVQDTLISVLYQYPALVPPMPSLSKAPPATPQICRVQGTPSTVKLAWHVCDILSGDEAPHYFAIYRFDGEKVNPDTVEPNHAWNAVCLDGEWFETDLTAAAGQCEGGSFQKERRDEYFQMSPQLIERLYIPINDKRRSGNSGRVILKF